MEKVFVVYYPWSCMSYGWPAKRLYLTGITPTKQTTYPKPEIEND